MNAVAREYLIFQMLTLLKYPKDLARNDLNARFSGGGGGGGGVQWFGFDFVSCR